MERKGPPPHFSRRSASSAGRDAPPRGHAGRKGKAYGADREDSRYEAFSRRRRIAGCGPFPQAVCARGDFDLEVEQDHVVAQKADISIGQAPEENRAPKKGGAVEARYLTTFCNVAILVFWLGIASKQDYCRRQIILSVQPVRHDVGVNPNMELGVTSLVIVN